MKLNLLLVGCGHLGTALLSRWLTCDWASCVTVLQPSGRARDSYAKDSRVTVCTTAAALPKDRAFDAVIVAVPPSAVDQALPELRPFIGLGTVVISVAAGKTLTIYEKHLGQIPVVRTMPNIAAAVGQSMTVACANPFVTKAQKKVCDTLLSAIGSVAWINDESLMDAVTALSGSGLAYVFLLMETLANSGAHLGLAPDLAQILARQTIIGAASLAAQSSEPAEHLRHSVTTPKGTTAAALKVLMDQGALQKLFDQALTAARNRAKELVH